MPQRRTETSIIEVTSDNGDIFTLIKETDFSWTPVGGGQWIAGPSRAKTTEGNAAMQNKDGTWNVYDSPYSSGNKNFVIAKEE